MTRDLSLSLQQVISLTNEAVVLIDVASETVRYVSPRGLEMLDHSGNASSTLPISNLLDPDDGNLKAFLDNAAATSSPLVARVRRRADREPLMAKALRTLTTDGNVALTIVLSGKTELSRRFRLLADKISALDLEVERRRAAESRLNRKAIALERTLVAARQIAEIDLSEDGYLHHALEALQVACEGSGSAVLTPTSGGTQIRAAVGQLAQIAELNAVLDLPTGLEHLWDEPDLTRVEYFRAALSKAARGATDVRDLVALPLILGSGLNGCLLLQGAREHLAEAEILSEVLASLMRRAGVEAHLRHAQKLRAIGELTGGIAHDFNNILAVVLGNAELMLDEVGRFGPDSLEVELTKSIRDSALRGGTLTSRLLSFARKQPLRPESHSLNTILRDLSTLLRRAIGEKIDIEIIGAGGLWKTRLDRGQFENAVLNLAVNARDAMSEGGRLTIETANMRLDSEYAAQHSEVTPGQYVMVAVTDSGTGMTPEVIREAFTPFFTTKGVGRGSGLGLSMVFGFVKQSGGHIKIYSEIGQGTTIRLYFPRDMTDARPDMGEEAAAPEQQPVTSNHVLLVEDDPALLRYAERTLHVLGYTVDATLTGDDAAGLLRSRAYDILLTDVILPGDLNGARLADLAGKFCPGIKVLFMSGYTENAIVHNGKLDPGVELITKPFTRDQLARRLRVLGSKDS